VICLNKITSFFFFLIVFPVSVHCQTEIKGGTLVLIYGDTSKVVVAADSRILLNDSIPSKNNGCKIKVFGNNVVFVSTGLYSSTQGWDVFKIANDSYNPDSSIKSIVELFSYRALSQLSKFMIDIKNDTVMYNKYLHNPPVESAWIGLHDNQLAVFWVSFQPMLSEHASQANSYSMEGWKSGWGRDLWLPLGIHGFIRSYVDGNSAKNFLQTYGVVDGLTRLIQNDIGFFPNHVSEPIDVLIFNGNGVSWQRKKNECKECEICPDTLNKH